MESPNGKVYKKLTPEEFNENNLSFPVRKLLTALLLMAHNRLKENR